MFKAVLNNPLTTCGSGSNNKVKKIFTVYSFQSSSFHMLGRTDDGEKSRSRIHLHSKSNAVPREFPYRVHSTPWVRVMVNYH